MRLLFIGDVVGRAGRVVLQDELPPLRKAWNLDCVIVNGENAAGGFGINEQILNDFLSCGADCVTLGNHAFDQREALTFIAHQPRLIRPLNYPKGTPGRGASLIETKAGGRILVVNALGRSSWTRWTILSLSSRRRLPPVLWAKPAMPQSSIFMPRPQARNRLSRIFSTAAFP